MALLPLRTLEPKDPARRWYEDWLAAVEADLAAPGADWYRLARDLLFQIYFPGHGDYEGMLGDPKLPLAARAALLALDPHHITLEPEYYADVDPARFARVKPLLWLWQSFDRSPMGGGNVHLGVRFRRLLAPHIFARCGRNFKCFHFVEFSFGYNLEVGDDVVVHRHVLLDDRGGITLGNRVSISDYANIYSHTHSIVDQKDVTNARTVLEDDVRITYHATVLAGVRVGRNSMVGAAAVATKDVRPYHVNVGIPAKSVRVKPNAPPEAWTTERVSGRYPTEGGS
jgi:acetyltransferase-like isoleucine patch superfamily enzyme